MKLLYQFRKARKLDFESEHDVTFEEIFRKRVETGSETGKVVRRPQRSGVDSGRPKTGAFVPDSPNHVDRVPRQRQIRFVASQLAETQNQLTRAGKVTNLFYFYFS